MAAALTPDAPPLAWESVRTAAGGGPALFMATPPDGEAERRGLTADIARRRARGLRLRDMAVLCRTHAQADAIGAALREAGLPALAARPLTDSVAVREMLGLIALLADDPAGLPPIAAAQGVTLAPDELRTLAAAVRRVGLFAAG
ncbi:MAG: hypothetical protein NTZ05_01710, partial [Chloroflexi bacterium]|nr:hypothetical protein [Chloroflexota bacterium]